MAQSLPHPTGGAGSRGTLVLTLFSLPFCAVGLFMAGWLATGLARGEPWPELATRGVFALAFGGAGFGLLFFSRWAAARAAEAAALRARHPGEPWRWREEWATGRIPAQDGATAVVACLVALVWNAVSAPLLVIAPGAMAEGEPLAAVGLLFPAVGVGLAVWAVRAVWRRRRFGRCVLELGTLPGVIGGPLRGTIHVPTAVRPADGLHVTLTCVHRVTTSSGDSRSTSEQVRWQEETTLPPTRVMAGAMGSAIPVEFTVPGDVPPSSPESSDDEHVWRLEAGADVPGVDFHTRFEVPVFRTAESRDDVRSARAGEPDLALSAAPTPIAEGSRITAAAIPGGIEVHLPPGRDPAGAALVTGMALFWNGFVGFMAFRAPAPALPFLALFGLGGLLVVVAALDAWLGSIRLRARRGSLEVTRRFLGIGRTRIHGLEALDALGIEVSGNVGNRVFYALKARRPGREKRSTLTGGLGDRETAERILALLEDALAHEA